MKSSRPHGYLEGFGLQETCYTRVCCQDIARDLSQKDAFLGRDTFHVLRWEDEPPNAGLDT